MKKKGFLFCVMPGVVGCDSTHARIPPSVLRYKSVGVLFNIADDPYLFRQGMLQVPNPTGYKGIAIAKRKEDEPKTDEPIVYAYARIIQKRRPVVASEVVLGLAEDKDRVTRCVLRQRSMLLRHSPGGETNTASHL